MCELVYIYTIYLHTELIEKEKVCGGKKTILFI